jgi:glucose-6-phosphate dehydrogenase assembly protein OpcA
MSQLGQETPIAEITNGLRALWDADHAKSRAALMNLVIYAEDDTTLEEMAADAEQIGASQACRALIIRNRPCGEGHELPPKAWITAHCRLGGGSGGLVCCEQVAFALCAENNNQLRNIVFAHLDSDLPLVFWWRGELTDNFEHRLHSRFDRLIVDSDTWQDPSASIARAAAAREEGGAHFVLHDLAWSRTHGLRLAVADCFEDPSARAALDKIESIGITHSPSHPQSARLVAGWLAARLGWPELRSASIFRYHVAAGAPVSSIEISAGSSRFTVTQEDAITATSALPGRHSHQILPAGPTSAADVAAEMLSRGGRNELYLTAATPQG